MKDYNQVDFDWSGDNTAEAREEAGKELVRFLERQAKFIEEGEEITIIAHSHGGNVVKYASRDLKSLLDRVIFMATPHRTDAKFNFKSMKKGGKVFNVYDRGDYLIQQWGGSVDGIEKPSVVLERLENMLTAGKHLRMNIAMMETIILEESKYLKDVGVAIERKYKNGIPDAKQTMHGAENIAIGSPIPVIMRPIGLLPVTLSAKLIQSYFAHTRIHTPEKWNRNIAPRIAK